MAGLRATVSALKEYQAITRRTGEPPAMVEADAMRQMALDEVGFSPIGGSARDLPPWNQDRMQEKALHMYRTNHMAHRLLAIVVDFVTGDGISVIAKGEDEAAAEGAAKGEADGSVPGRPAAPPEKAKPKAPEVTPIQDAIDEFWQDPINAMDRENPQRLLEWRLWGEILMPVRTSEDGSGRIRLGWIDPGSIKTVEPDPYTSVPSQIKIRDSALARVGYPILDVVRFREESERLEGNAFFMTINNVKGACRGISDLYTAYDWLRTMDQTLRAAAIRAEAQSAYIWDVLLKGKKEPDIRTWLQAHRAPPAPGTIRAHNESVEWKAVSPDLGAPGTGQHIQDIKTFIMGGFGFPNHWFGSGDDANLATASVMAEPTRKRLRRIGKEFGFLLEDVVAFALTNRAAVEGSKLVIDADNPRPFEVRIPDISGPDVAKVGAAVVAVTNAIVVAEEKGYVSHETAMSLFAAIAAQTGLEIDAAAEQQKIDVEDVHGAKDDAAASSDQEQAAAAAIARAMGAAGGTGAAPPGAPPAKPPGARSGQSLAPAMPGGEV
jgi:hypothetical protein